MDIITTQLDKLLCIEIEFIIKDFINYIFKTIKNGKNNLIFNQLCDMNENNCTPYNFDEIYYNQTLKKSI